MNLDKTLNIDTILQRQGLRTLRWGCFFLFVVPMSLANPGWPRDDLGFWLTLLLGLTSVSIGLAIVLGYLGNLLQPEKRREFLWPEVGTPVEVHQAIEDDWNLSPEADKYRQGISYLTPSWLLRWSDAVPFQAFPLRYAALVYCFLPPLTSKAVVAIHWTGNTSVTTIEVPDWEAGRMLMAELQERAPWAYFGLSEENYLGWTTDHHGLIEAVHGRYDQVQSGVSIPPSPLATDDAVECFELPLKPLKSTERRIADQIEIAAILRDQTLSGFLNVGVFLLVIPLGCWIVGALLGRSLPIITILTAIVAALSGLIGMLGVWSETMDSVFPELRSEFQLPALGDAAQVRQRVEADWNQSTVRDKLRFGDFYLTPAWLLEWGSIRFRPLPLRYAAWAYASEEKRGWPWQRSQATVVIYWTNGRESLTVPLNARIDATEFLAGLQQRAPWAFIGDTPANQRRWSESQELFIQTVVDRWELVRAGQSSRMPTKWDEDAEDWIIDDPE